MLVSGSRSLVARDDLWRQPSQRGLAPGCWTKVHVTVNIRNSLGKPRTSPTLTTISFDYGFRVRAYIDRMCFFGCSSLLSIMSISRRGGDLVLHLPDLTLTQFPTTTTTTVFTMRVDSACTFSHSA